MQRTCEECGKKITGRSDKKFCSDACRNGFNNKVNSDSTNYMRNVNNTLRKNKRILSTNLKGEKTKVHRDTLVKEGFIFEYFTNIYTTQKGLNYYFCYEYGYLLLDDNMILIVKKEFN